MRAALYWTAVAVLLLPGGGLAAQEALELREAARLALAAHPAALAARASVEGARGATAEARAATLPWLSIDGLAVRHQEPMVVAPLHGFDPLQPPVFERTLVQGSVSAGYTLFDGGTRGARVARARAREAGTEAGRRAADAQLMLATAGAFLDVLGSRELARAHASRVASLGEETQRAGRLHAEGRVARVAVLRAEAALALAEAERIAGEARRDAAERQLARLIGWEYERVTAAALPAPLPPSLPPLAEALAAAAGSSPEVERASAQVQAALAGRREARATWLPRLQAAARFTEFGSAAGAFQGEWQAGVQLAYPLFTGGQRSGSVLRAQADLRHAEQELRLAHMNVADAVEQAHARARAAAARVDALNVAVAQLEEVARIERLALETGAGVQTEYLLAEAELLRGRAGLTEARATAVLAIIELARIAGLLTAEWFEGNVEVEG
jgi:outer membrane protein TolC